MLTTTMSAASAVAARAATLHVPPYTGSTATVDSTLMEAGRFLLTFSMALFVSYLLFVTGCILVASIVGYFRTANHASADDPAGAHVRFRAPHHRERGGERPTVRNGEGDAAAPHDATAVPAHQGGVGR